MPTASRIFALACFAALALQAASPNVVISQVYGGGGNAGAQYTNDFIELYNTSSSPVVMTNWQVAYASATGTSWTNRTIFSGTIAAHGYFLIQEAGSTPSNLPAPDVSGGAINLSATAGKLALLNDSIAPTVACPKTNSDVVDFVGYGTTANCNEGTANAPAPSNTTSITRTAPFTDTDQNGTDFTTEAPTPHNSGNTAPTLSITSLSPSSAIAGGSSFILTVNGTAINSPATVNFNSTALTGTVVNATKVTATVPANLIALIGNYPVTVTSGGSTSNSLTFMVTGQPTCTPTHTIAQIQGNTDTSPYVSTTVTQTTTGIVTHLRSTGFFMQMATGDGDVTTSDGIYVFTSSAPTVSLGDSVCVTALVQEYTPGTGTDPVNTLTELTSPGITTLSSGNALPAAVTISPAANGAYDQLERYEGMRVQIASATVTGPTGGTLTETAETVVSNGSFYAVATGTARPFREPGIDVSHPIAATLPACCIPLFDSNPELIDIYTGDPGVTKVDVAAGAVVTGISGVLDVYYGAYELDVDPSATLNVSNNSLVFTPVAAGLSTQLTVGTFNMERFYDTVDDPATQDVVLTPAAFELRLAKASLAIRNVLNTPDILALQEMENLSTLQTLAARISSDAISASQPDPQYAAYLVSGNDIGGINVAFLVKSARVTNVTATQYGKTTTYTDPNTNQQAILNDRPPLVLTGSVHNGGTAPLPVTVISNHLKALPADDPTDTRVRVKRNAQAVFLANLIQSFQAATPGTLIVSVGDYNAFEFNDGTTDVVGIVEGTPAPSNQDLVPSSALVNPTLTELSSTQLPANQRYSYVENGSAQQLDHILISPSAQARLTQFAIGHLDAEFPLIYRNDSTRPERTSDHDPEVAYFTLPTALDVTASVNATSSGVVMNRATGLYNGTITITNKTAASLAAPIQVALLGLPAGVTLANASGNLGGVPYVTSAASSLAAGASLSVPVQFQLTGSVRPSYTINVYSGTL